MNRSNRTSCYRTGLIAYCENKHRNTIDNRVYAKSEKEAQKLSVENVKKTKCNWCDSLCVNIGEILATEKIPFYPIYEYRGFTCRCGEKVSVSQTEQGDSESIPEQITVSCSKGHLRTIQDQEFLLLETWTEQTQ
jgi:hypothetical protein